MTPIIQALGAGYGEQEILDYLAKAAPSLARSIGKARKTGYSAAAILDFLSKTMQDDEYNPYLSQEASHKKVAEQRARKTKELLKTGAGALATYGAARAVPAAIQGIKEALQKTPSTNIGPTPMSNAPIKPPPIPGSSPIQPTPPELPSQALAQPKAAPVQPQPTISPETSINLVEQMGIGERIKNLKDAGNTPEAITTAISVSLKPHQKKFLEDQVKSGKAKTLPEIINDYLTQPPTEVKDETGIETQVPKVEPQKPTKGELVSTSDGIVGEVQDIRNKEALVKDDDGKLHKVKVEELQKSPLPEKELADLHEDLISGIEKETGEDVSRNVNWAGYDPETNTLVYLPHLGNLYQYDEISEEDVKLLTSFLNTRKTTGKNFIGAWGVGTKSPIGAAMSALIKRLQSERGGKGKEYSREFQTVYSAYEPAQKAAKKKKEKK